MRKLLLNTCTIALVTFISTASHVDARSPVFMNDYQTQGKESDVISIYRPNSRSVQIPNRSPEDFFVKTENPFEKVGFGRVKTERDFYDKESGRYYNQYDFIGLLAARGNRTAANELARRLQQDGVYDSGKAKDAVRKKLSDHKVELSEKRRKADEKKAYDQRVAKYSQENSNSSTAKSKAITNTKSSAGKTSSGNASAPIFFDR